MCWRLFIQYTRKWIKSNAWWWWTTGDPKYNSINQTFTYMFLYKWWNNNIIIIYGAPSIKSLERLRKHKDMLISTHTHAHACTHTHYKYMHYWWWIGKTTDQYAEQKRWIFSFDLREWRQMPDRERKGIPEHRSNVLKGSLTQGSSAHTRNTEDVSIHGWAKRVRRRVDMK